MAQVTVESLENLRVRVSTSEHSLVADEPKGVGDGEGPDPYELLLGALGSCTAMTLLLYARRKKWPLRHVKAELEIGQIHARDCEECEQDDGKVDRITVRLHLDGELDDEQRERLADIATRCPVRKTLLALPMIVDTLV